MGEKGGYHHSSQKPTPTIFSRTAAWGGVISPATIGSTWSVEARGALTTDPRAEYQLMPSVLCVSGPFASILFCISCILQTREPPSPPFKGMGIQDLTKLVEDADIYTTPVATLAGSTLAWDISCLLHVAISSREGADQYHAFPPVPVSAVCESIDQVVGLFKAFNINLIAVFDGVQHPQKGRVSEKREVAARTKLEKLRSLWRRGDPEDFGEVQRLKKGCCRVRADIIYMAVERLRKLGIPCVGAPFEAEWQCAQLQVEGKVQGILSKDSDVLALGATNLVQKYTRRRLDGRTQLYCSLLRREDVLRKLGDKVGGELTPHGFLALCTFLGNDYILRVRNNGVPACLELTADFMATHEGGQYEFFKRFEVDDSGRKRKWNESGGDVEDYQRYFNMSVNLFKYAPIFKKGPDDSLSICPLNALPDGAAWEGLIGFDPISLFASCGCTLHEAFTMEEACRYGKSALKPLPYPECAPID